MPRRDSNGSTVGATTNSKAHTSRYDHTIQTGRVVPAGLFFAYVKISRALSKTSVLAAETVPERLAPPVPGTPGAEVLHTAA
jgi:hypothetical protein